MECGVDRNALQWSMDGDKAVTPLLPSSSCSFKMITPVSYCDTFVPGWRGRT
jgi:hypothetical protein